MVAARFAVRVLVSRTAFFTEIRHVANAFLVLRRQRTVFRIAGTELRISRSSRAEFGGGEVGRLRAKAGNWIAPLDLLAAEAHKVGIKRFTFVALPENTGISRLLARFGAVGKIEDGLLTADLGVGAIEPL